MAEKTVVAKWKDGEMVSPVPRSEPKPVVVETFTKEPDRLKPGDDTKVKITHPGTDD